MISEKRQILIESALFFNEDTLLTEGLFSKISDLFKNMKRNHAIKVNIKEIRNMKNAIVDSRYFFESYRRCSDMYAHLAKFKNAARNIDIDTMLDSCKLIEEYEVFMAYNHFVTKYEEYFKDDSKAIDPVFVGGVKVFKQYFDNMTSTFNSTVKLLDDLGKKDESLTRLTIKDYTIKIIKYGSDGEIYTVSLDQSYGHKYALILFNKGKRTEEFNRNVVETTRYIDAMFELKRKIDGGEYMSTTKRA